MQYLYFILCGILGVAIHCCFKFQSLKSDAKAGNVDYTLKDYLSKDTVAIVASFVSVGIWLLCFAEVAAVYPKLQTFSRVSFVVMGAMGSWIIQLALGKGKKYIRNIVDKKTDIADGK